MSYSIIDLHCDLTTYLATVPNADPYATDDIGCAISHLKDGNVKLQVMAFYSGGTSKLTQGQCDWFRRLADEHRDTFRAVGSAGEIAEVVESSKIGILAAIENGSAICDEDEPLASGLERLESVRSQVGPLLYISLTHHGENRFGGGNMTAIGLKDDGRRLLDYLAGKRIAVDLSHTSDALAYGILDHIDRRSLELQVVASHSNMRLVFDFPRNLPDELALEVIRRGGIIGINFVRAFLHPDDPSYLTKHIIHGLELGGKDALCFGADFFYFKDYPNPDRWPFFFDQHSHAGKYPSILRELENEIGTSQVKAMASGNAMSFLNRFWPE